MKSAQLQATVRSPAAEAQGCLPGSVEGGRRCWVPRAQGAASIPELLQAC